jgi:hypothetical protein
MNMTRKGILLPALLVYGRYDERFGQETGGLGINRCHLVSVGRTGERSSPALRGEFWLRRCATIVAIFVA